MCAYLYNGPCIYGHVSSIDIDMLPPVLSVQFLLARGPMMCIIKSVQSAHIH